MALPPSRLTTLLYDAGESPESLVAALAEHGCLTQEVIKAPARLLALLEATIAEAEARPPMPGPSTQDRLVQALLGTVFLSAQGRRWASTPPPPGS
jgi:hypothetical protein